MLGKFKRWKERNFYNGFYCIKVKNPYVHGTIGTDIKLTLKDKFFILFCRKGIDVALVEGNVEE